MSVRPRAISLPARSFNTIASPALNVPSTPITPIGRRLVPRVHSASRAPSSTTTSPAGLLPQGDPELPGLQAGRPAGEERPDRLALDRVDDDVGSPPIADDHRDSGLHEHLGGLELGDHAAGAHRRTSCRQRPLAPGR